jgi:CheY-like chemotaxis protein
MLEGRGYEVVQASDGGEVLRMKELSSADLLITDIVMPNVEGTELIMRLRSKRPELPILALSGHATTGVYLDVASKLGAQKTLAKPFPSSALIEAVRELVGE